MAARWCASRPAAGLQEQTPTRGAARGAGAATSTIKTCRSFHAPIAATIKAHWPGDAARAAAVKARRAVHAARETGWTSRMAAVKSRRIEHPPWAAAAKAPAMIAHVVLFRLKRDLTEDDRETLANALAHAAREIPSLRRSRVGSRVILGRAYEQLMTTDYSFAAMLEFDDRDGLQAYLDHPVHEHLAQRFYASVDHALTYDFELWETDEGIERIRGVV